MQRLATPALFWFSLSAAAEASGVEVEAANCLLERFRPIFINIPVAVMGVTPLNRSGNSTGLSDEIW